MKYPVRHIAAIIIEAKTPIAPGSGEKSVLSDSMVATDYNGLPYIPATSLAGVLRNFCAIDDKESIFGAAGDKPSGSRLIISEARPVDLDGRIMDGITCAPSDDMKNLYCYLPVRQHVRISYRGVHCDTGKFDNQIVHRGSRFAFEMELLSEDTGSGEVAMESLLSTMSRPDFRIGGGTRKGYGKIAMVRHKIDVYDLSTEDGLEQYIERSSSLQTSWKGGSEPERVEEHGRCTAAEDCSASADTCNWKSYKLTLRPENFFMFGSGYADQDADNFQLKEKYIEWKDGKGTVMEGIVIPASSVKGAIVHRTLFYYNCLKNNYIDDKEDVDAQKAFRNEARKALEALFGYVNGNLQAIGKVIFDDIVMRQEKGAEKVNNHVMIDRFTGGAYPGALYNEKACYADGNDGMILSMTYHIDSALENSEILNAFNMAVDDICNGNLPLGGAVNRGLGVFIGSKSEIG